MYVSLIVSVSMLPALHHTTDVIVSRNGSVHSAMSVSSEFLHFLLVDIHTVRPIGINSLGKQLRELLIFDLCDA